MARKTNMQQLLERREKQPSSILYAILMLVVKVLNSRVKTSFTIKADPSKEKRPFILVSNHASRNDYLFTAPPCYPRKLNYVVGYNEFFRFPTNILLKTMQVIPKKNFTPDVHCIRGIERIIHDGGAICIMPEGMSSITGMCQPIMPGIGRLLKKLKVPVYYTKISGAYLTYTKHCLDERLGRCEVVVDKMFEPEDYADMTEAQIEDTMNRLLAHDDYIWNKQSQVSFVGKQKDNMAKQLDSLLYMCPKCGQMYQMECSGNTMTCKCCGNKIQIDNKYNISPVGEDSVCPELVTDWTLLERQKAAQQVSEPDFRYSVNVKVGLLPEHGSLKGSETSVICGQGELTLTAEGLNFQGTLKDSSYSFFLPIDSVPTYGMCTDITRLYTFVDGKFIEFYLENGEVLRFDHLTEQMHRFKGGKWQDTDYRHQA